MGATCHENRAKTSAIPPLAAAMDVDVPEEEAVDPVTGLPHATLIPCKSEHRVPRALVKSIKENKIRFDLVNTSPAVAAAFRRIFLEEVPSAAARFVTVRKNGTLLDERHIALRLGLLPIRFRDGKGRVRCPMQVLNMYHECRCATARCDRCCVRGTIKSRPHAGSSGSFYVTSRDITFEGRDDGLVPYVVEFQDSKLEELCERVVPPKNRGAVVCMVKGDMELEMDFEVTMGTGSDNARYICGVLIYDMDSADDTVAPHADRGHRRERPRHDAEVHDAAARGASARRATRVRWHSAGGAREGINGRASSRNPDLSAILMSMSTAPAGGAGTGTGVAPPASTVMLAQDFTNVTKMASIQIAQLCNLLGRRKIAISQMYVSGPHAHMQALSHFAVHTECDRLLFVDMSVAVDAKDLLRLLTDANADVATVLPASYSIFGDAALQLASAVMARVSTGAIARDMGGQYMCDFPTNDFTPTVMETEFLPVAIVLGSVLAFRRGFLRDMAPRRWKDDGDSEEAAWVGSLGSVLALLKEDGTPWRRSVGVHAALDRWMLSDTKKIRNSTRKAKEEGLPVMKGSIEVAPLSLTDSRRKPVLFTGAHAVFASDDDIRFPVSVPSIAQYITHMRGKAAKGGAEAAIDEEGEGSDEGEEVGGRTDSSTGSGKGTD